jgi:hypothetical protein
MIATGLTSAMLLEGKGTIIIITMIAAMGTIYRVRAGMTTVLTGAMKLRSSPIMISGAMNGGIFSTGEMTNSPAITGGTLMPKGSAILMIVTEITREITIKILEGLLKDRNNLSSPSSVMKNVATCLKGTGTTIPFRTGGR